MGYCASSISNETAARCIGSFQYWDSNLSNIFSSPILWLGILSIIFFGIFVLPILMKNEEVSK